MVDLKKDFQQFSRPMAEKAMEEQRKQTKEMLYKHKEEWDQIVKKYSELDGLLFSVAGGTLTIFAALSIDKTVNLYSKVGFLLIGISALFYLLQKFLSEISNTYFTSMSDIHDFKFQKSMYESHERFYGSDISTDVQMIDLIAPNQIGMREHFKKKYELTQAITKHIPFGSFLIINGQRLCFVLGIILISIALFIK